MKKWNFLETEIRIDSAKINWTSFREENCFLAAHANKFRFDFFFNDFYLLLVVSLADLTCDWLSSRPMRGSDLTTNPFLVLNQVLELKQEKYENLINKQVNLPYHLQHRESIWLVHSIGLFCHPYQFYRFGFKVELVRDRVSVEISRPVPNVGTVHWVVLSEV